MSKANYYALLRVGRNATTQEVTQAYHKIAKKLHPDLQRVACPKKDEELKACTAAYNVLRDEKQRRQYDRELGFTSAARRGDFEGRFTLYRNRRADRQAHTRRSAGGGGGGGGGARGRGGHEQEVMFNHNLHQQAHYPPKHILAWQERQQEKRARDKAEHTNDAEAMRHRTYFRRAESRHQAADPRASHGSDSAGAGGTDRDERGAWAEAEQRHGRKPSDGEPPCCVM